MAPPAEDRGRRHDDAPLPESEQVAKPGSSYPPPPEEDSTSAHGPAGEDQEDLTLPVSQEDHRRAQHARRILVVALTVLSVAIVALAGTWLVTGAWRPSWSAADDGVVCPTQLLMPATPQDTAVNVYNGSESKGRAAVVARELSSDGFDVADVANAKLPRQAADGPGLILSSPDTVSQALALQQRVPGASVVLQPERNDDRIDLVLGAGFRGLAHAKDVQHGPGRLRCTQPVFDR